MAKPTSAARPAEQGSTPEGWRAVTGRVHADLASLLSQNQAYFAARGPKAVEERDKLAAAADQFTKERLPEVEDAGGSLPDAAKAKVAEYIRQLRRAAEDLKTKENTGAGEALLERYRIEAIEQEMASGKPS